jgi:hypothetical protein
LHKSWDEILYNFPKQVEISNVIVLEKDKIKKEIIINATKVINKKIELKSIEKPIIENNIGDNSNILQTPSIWSNIKSPFIWLLDKLGF